MDAMVYSTHRYRDGVNALTIQILYFDGCPHLEPTVELVRRALSDAGVDADIELLHIDSPELAESSRFLGSPTIRVDGVDIDPGARKRDDFGLTCRRYGDSGVPPREMIVRAVGAGNGGSRG